MKEREIRNIDVLDRYLKMVEKDMKTFFELKSFVKVGCPSCGGTETVDEFEKANFRYVTCKGCGTLFANPRPPFEALKKFYSDSPSATFWVNEFFKPMAEARREKIFKPRAQYIAELLGTGHEKHVIGDIGAGFGLFLEELRKISPKNDYVAIEPSPEMARICTGKGFKSVASSFEETEGMNEAFDMLTGFELLEHLFDPLAFLKKANFMLKRGAYIFLTTLNSKGFDIQLLWERSRSVVPPHHLNFFNIHSGKFLLEKAGFEIIEISTPGRLDWDIVEGTIRKEGIDVGRFWKTLAREGDEECKSALQDWISKNNLSSHMWILAKRHD